MDNLYIFLGVYLAGCFAGLGAWTVWQLVRDRDGTTSEDMWTFVLSWFAFGACVVLILRQLTLKKDCEKFLREIEELKEELTSLKQHYRETREWVSKSSWENIRLQCELAKKESLIKFLRQRLSETSRKKQLPLP